MPYLVLFSALVLAGCSSGPPVVDQTKVSPAQYAADEAECVRTHGATLTLGSPITRCMRMKGYKILEQRS
jgi:hypothetical protein